MDAEEVIDKNWDQHQRIDDTRINRPIEAFADLIDRIRCLIRGQRREEDLFSAVRMGGCNIILGAFETSSDPALGVFVQIPVQLETG